MALLNTVSKKVLVTNWDIIKFQLVTYCFLNRIPISDSDLDCLSFLGQLGESELTTFCSVVSEKKIFKSSQTVRNVITKAEKFNLILKQGNSKKKILLNPDLKIQTKGNILLDFKLYHLEPKEA